MFLRGAFGLQIRKDGKIGKEQIFRSCGFEIRKLGFVTGDL